jgi:hypothetical protein
VKDHAFHRQSSSGTDIVPFKPDVEAPFESIRRLFDHLQNNPEHASALNATYPKRGIFKTAAASNGLSDQKYTIDLSLERNDRIAELRQGALAGSGLDEVLNFFQSAHDSYVEPILSTMSELTGVELGPSHNTQNVNYRLCDYNPQTAAPESDNGCGAHTDYGTFSIIFQDDNSGLEIEHADHPGQWTPVPGGCAVVLAGWCAVILTGGGIRATRHRVRRTPGVRRLSAVLFVAPDLDVPLMPIDVSKSVRPFSRTIMAGEANVRWFKAVMGKKWRRREGNEGTDEGDAAETQDKAIEKLVWG